MLNPSLLVQHVTVPRPCQRATCTVTSEITFEICQDHLVNNHTLSTAGASLDILDQVLSYMTLITFLWSGW